MSFISKLFSRDDDEFNEVRVDREVLESVIYYSKKAYPNEFLAFFDGEIKDKTLYITSLVFLPGETCFCVQKHIHHHKRTVIPFCDIHAVDIAGKDIDDRKGTDRF